MAGRLGMDVGPLSKTAPARFEAEFRYGVTEVRSRHPARSSGDRCLPADYEPRALAIIERQVHKAAIRLAWLLNRLLP
jgi:hypothetical protein